MMEKKDMLIIIGISLIAMAVLLVFISKSEKSTKNRLTGLEIAEQSLLFADRMRLPDNTYFLNEECSGRRSESIPQSNAWAILAYSGIYEATGDEKYIGAIEREIDVIDSDSRFLDVYQSYSLSTVQMKKAYDLLKTRSEKAESLALHIVAFADTLSWINDVSIMDSAMLSAIAAREILYAKDFLENEEYPLEDDLKTQMIERFEMKAEEYLNNAKDIEASENAWDTQGELELKGSTCYISLAEIEMGMDDDFLFSFDFEKAIAENEKRETELRAVVLQPCIEASLLMYRKTGNKRYVDKAENMASYLIESKWDTEEDQVCNGDYGILIDNNEKMKFSTDTFYQIYLLSQDELKDKVILG